MLLYLNMKNKQPLKQYIKVLQLLAQLFQIMFVFYMTLELTLFFHHEILEEDEVHIGFN